MMVVLTPQADVLAWHSASVHRHNEAEEPYVVHARSVWSPPLLEQMSLNPPNLMRYHRQSHILLPPPLRDSFEAHLEVLPVPCIVVPWRAVTRGGPFPSRIVGPMRRVFCTHCDSISDRGHFARHARLRAHCSLQEKYISMVTSMETQRASRLHALHTWPSK
jgi:hypothetical protein